MFMRTVMLQLAAVNTADGRVAADLGGVELDLKTFSSVSALSHKPFFSCQDFHIVNIFWVLFLSSDLPWKPSYLCFDKMQPDGLLSTLLLKSQLVFPTFLGKRNIFRVFSHSFLFSSSESLHLHSARGRFFFSSFESGKDGVSPQTCAGLDSQISLACDEVGSSLLAAPQSSQDAVTFSLFSKVLQQSNSVPNSSHMLQCFTTFELCSLFITSKKAAHLLIILSEVSIVDKKD